MGISNNDPKIIAGYYLNSIQQLQGNCNDYGTILHIWQYTTV